MWFFAHKSLPNLLFGVPCLPGDQSHPVCTTNNKPSCVLHLLGWFIGSRGFSSLERRPEFWVLQPHHTPLSASSSGSSTKAVSDLSIVERKVCVRWSLSGVELCPLPKDTLESCLPEPVIVTVFGNRVFADGITEVKMRSDWSVCVGAKSLESCPTLCDPMDSRLFCPWDSPGKNTGVGCHFLLQGIFPTQGSKLRLLHLLLWQAGSLPLVPPGKPLSWSAGWLTSDDWCPYRKKGDHVRTEAETGVGQPQAKEGLAHQDCKRQERLLCRPWREPACQDLNFRLLGSRTVGK